MENKINQIEQLLGIKLTTYQKIMLMNLLEDEEKFYNGLKGAEYIASLAQKSDAICLTSTITTTQKIQILLLTNSSIYGIIK